MNFHKYYQDLSHYHYLQGEMEDTEDLVVAS